MNQTIFQLLQFCRIYQTNLQGFHTSQRPSENLSPQPHLNCKPDKHQPHQAHGGSRELHAFAEGLGEAVAGKHKHIQIGEADGLQNQRQNQKRQGGIRVARVNKRHEKR